MIGYLPHASGNLVTPCPARVDINLLSNTHGATTKSIMLQIMPRLCMCLRSRRNYGVSSANRLHMRLRKLSHDGRCLVVYVRQTTLLSRAVIVDRVLCGSALRI